MGPRRGLALDGRTLLVGSNWDNPESPVGHVAVYDLNSRLRRKPFCATARAGIDRCGTGFSSNESLIRHIDAADVDVRLEMRAMQRVELNFLDAVAVPHEMGEVLQVHVRLVAKPTMA